MDLVLRPAEPTDIAAIIELGTDPAFAAGGGMPFYYRDEVLKEWIDHPAENTLCVAENEGKVVGFLFCKLMHSRWAMLDTLYLAPVARGRGLGRAMFQAFFEQLKQRGVIYLSTLILKGRTDWEKIAVSQGFEIAETYSWFGKLLIEPNWKE